MVVMVAMAMRMVMLVRWVVTVLAVGMVVVRMVVIVVIVPVLVRRMIAMFTMVVFMVRIIRQKVGVDVEFGVEVEAPQIKHLRQ